MQRKTIKQQWLVLKSFWVWVKIGWNIFRKSQQAALFVYIAESKTVKMHHVNMQTERDGVHLSELYAAAYHAETNRRLNIVKLQRFPHLN